MSAETQEGMREEGLGSLETAEQWGQPVVSKLETLIRKKSRQGRPL